MVPTLAHPLSASKLLTAIDDTMKFSDQDSDSDNDNDNFPAFTRTKNATNDE
jgi:hypothetical protein